MSAPTPKWVAQSPRFGELLAEAITEMLPPGLSVFDELDATVALMHWAARRLRAERAGRVAQSPAEHIHWILVGMRAARASDPEGVRKALCAVPELGDRAGGVNMAVARTPLLRLSSTRLKGRSGLGMGERSPSW